MIPPLLRTANRFPFIRLAAGTTAVLLAVVIGFIAHCLAVDEPSTGFSMSVLAPSILTPLTLVLSPP